MRGLLLILALVALSRATIDLVVQNDQREHFFIENFGYAKGGTLKMTVQDWKLEGKEPESLKAAFLVKVTKQDSNSAFLEENSDFDCILDEIDPNEEDTWILYNTANGSAYLEIPNISSEGFYNTYFINCLKTPVSFRLHLDQFNVDSQGNQYFISVGLSPLPVLYAVFGVVYFGLLALWIFSFMLGANKKINRIHHLMTIVVILKGLSLIFQAVDYHYLKKFGDAYGWAIVYYIFAALKTIFFFVIVALIGTGWSFIKPFLSDKDKKIIMVVIPLQVLDNIAMIILGETAQGSQGWFTWKDIFRLVDIICCGAVLIPIIWSIKHLREASQIDGKAARNLQKLKLFRHFYLIVVTYIYFTRIIIYLLDATLPFQYVWLGELFSELAAITFYCVVGYKFRPAADNPYFVVEDDEDAVRTREMENSTTDE